MKDFDCNKKLLVSISKSVEASGAMINDRVQRSAEGVRDQQSATTFSHLSSEGQSYDRIRESDPIAAVPTFPLPERGATVDVQITAGQKMLSAMSGSLLTSLIGKHKPSGPKKHITYDT